LARILVVDDELYIITIVKKNLELAGFEVNAFTKPEVALSHFEAGIYAMLITDIRMPGMSGFELYRQVKRIDDKIKVAFMTAFDVHKAEFKKVMPNSDVKCFFTKPFRMNDLVARVKQELADEFTLS
jgi:DNA-binding response OmpR family regulator